MKNLFAANLNFKKLVETYGSPLLILDQAVIRSQYNDLKNALPNVTLHYALKPLPLDTMVKELNELGSSFDLATNGEVDLARECNVDPRKCIHTHPIKRRDDIAYALEYGCDTFVFDNIAELHKFEEFADSAKLLLRVSFPNPETKVDLSKKFGCLPEEALDLLKKAKELNINVIGFSFHVGSQVPNARRHVEAIEACTKLINDAAQHNIDLEILDIGGGFPVDYTNAKRIDIDAFCAPIREALTKLPSHIRVLAEPGRFLSAPVMTNVCQVVGKSTRFGKPWYYLDDGVYCSYSGQIFDHVTYPKFTPYNSGTLTQSVLAGPTCDSIDLIAEDIMLPELEIGDLIVGRMTGAYTISTSTEFNFIDRTAILVIDSDNNIEELQKYKKVA